MKSVRCKIRPRGRKIPKIIRNILIAAAVSVYACSSLNAQVTVDIDAARTTGVAPLAVYFDGSGTTASGVSYPMHELYFEWDFDDSAAGNWSTSGLSKNFATGPAAAHVFETPGTYDVTLYVENASGDSDVEVVTITVTNPDTVYAGTNTICFSTDGDFSGAPSGSQQVTTSSLSTVMSYQGTNKRLLLKRGQTFNSGGGHQLTAIGPSMLGAFGSGSDPLIQATNSGALFIYRSPDWRIMDIEFEGNGQSGSRVAESRETTDILMLRTTVVPGTFHAGFSISGTGLDLYGEDIPQGVFIVDNDWQDFGFGTGGNIMFLTVGRFAIMGNHLEDSAGGEHIIRIAHGEKGVISNNYLGEQADTKQLLTIRNQNQNGECTSGCGRDTREIFISDNTFVNHSDWAFQLVAKNKSTDAVYGHDFIIERNFFKSGISGKGQRALVFTDADNVSIRNNVVLMNDWHAYRGIGISGDTDNAWVNNNVAYTNNPGIQTWLIDIGTGSGNNRVAKNNLLYAPNASSSSVVTGSGTDVSNNLNAGSNPFIASSIDGPEDFELSSSSVGKDVGTAVNVFIDYRLNPRPAGTTWDVGAYEYQAVTGVSVSPTSLALEESQTEPLSATVLPVNAANPGITWSSSNPTIATVSATGLVTALSEGSATITVTTDEGSYTDTCLVVVSETTVNTAPVLSISSPLSGLLYSMADSVVLNAVASDAEDGNLSSAISWVSDVDGMLGTGEDLIVTLSEATHTITAHVIDSGGESQAGTVNLTVYDPAIDNDADDIPDGWEAFYGISDPAADSDSDGVGNLREYQIGANPTSGDLVNGDINADNIVDARDVLLLQRHLLGVSVLNAQDRARADMHPAIVGDGSLTASDLLLLQKQVMGGAQ